MMSCIPISASLHTACNARYMTYQAQAGHLQLVGTKPLSQNAISCAEQKEQPGLNIDGSTKVENVPGKGHGNESSPCRLGDERWKNGTWDLNMFVKDGKMDWGGMIVAEAKRRKFLELYPEASTNEEPVLFKSSIIPWGAWFTRSYLLEAELLSDLNRLEESCEITELHTGCQSGRAAMVGFFVSYVVGFLSGLDMVGQTGNFVCKMALFLDIVVMAMFRRTEDLDKLRDLANEAIHYDKQWQAWWQVSHETDKDFAKKFQIEFYFFLLAIKFYFCLLLISSKDNT